MMIRSSFQPGSSLPNRELPRQSRQSLCSYRPLARGFEPLEDRRLLSVGAMPLELFGMSPALFVENQGQWSDAAVRYMHQGDAMQVAITDSGAAFRLVDRGSGPETNAPDVRPGTRGEVAGGIEFSVSYVGADSVAPVGREPSDTVFHYHVGDEANWRSAVPTFESVVYRELYGGIDLAVWGQRSQLKYEFYVGPGADWRQIQIRYDGIVGLSIAEDGSLIVDPGGGWEPLIDAAPYVYQEIDGQHVEIASQYVLVDPWTFGFELSGDYDPDALLVIDPELAWSTYLGGTGQDFGYGVDVDGSGNVVVTGETFSSDWVVGDGPPANGSWNAFVTKLSPSGQHLWSTFLGGDGTDFGQAVAIDSANNILVAGETGSAGWVSGGFDTTFNGNADGFVAKLNAAGQHVWSTYLGGSGDDGAVGVAVDTSGNTLVTGWTFSAGWTAGGFDTEFNGNADAFVVKLSAAGGHVWSTYLGGSGWDHGRGIATDAANSVLVTGWTSSAGWVGGGFDTTYNGNTDAFVTKLTSAGGHSWSTYLGGASEDRGYGIAVLGTDVVVTGWTASSGWTTGGFDTTFNGSTDAFVARLTGSGGHVWSTYLGGSNDDYGWSIASDAAAGILVTGGTRSSGWVSGGFDTTHNGNFDAFVAALTPAGQHQGSTYLGGSDRDFGNGIAVDSAGTVYVVGETNSPGWTTGGFNTTLSGSYDAFVAKIAFSRANPVYDLMGRIVSNGDWWLGESNGVDAFSNSKVNRWNPNLDWADIMVGDFTGSGVDDIAGRVVSTGDWWLAVNNGDGTFTNQRWGRWNPNVTFS
ncbi:MAG: SBBP repeat-containing protein, partial [Thermoguttaceae bacterium]|nr:SBBP repeat-containing protein [Thermoguttaceae bacterium]